jgi:site-specific DNA-methyltransferase (adenine-specific)
MKPITYHPACLLFPAMGEQELQELAADIKERGLLNPVVLFEGKVLDGRSRLAACKLAGVNPRFVDWDGQGSATEWVLSQNLFRRHLTSSQRAAVAFQMLPLLEAEAKERQRLSRGRGMSGGKNRPTFSTNGKASQVAARITKTNENYVKEIKAIHADAPDLIEAIRSGLLKVPEATTLVQLPKPKRKKVLRKLADAGPDRKVKQLIREVELDSLKASGRNDERSSCTGNVEIWCGDCLSFMPKKLTDKSISVVVTSPPFNLGVRYNKYMDDRPFGDYLEWLEAVFVEIKRVLEDDGSFFLNVGSSRTHPWNAMKIAEVAGKHFVLQNEITWVKAISINGNSFGHLTPVMGHRFLHHNFESIYHFTKTGKVALDRLAIGVPYKDGTNLLRNSAASDVRCAGDVWFIPHETVHGKNDKGFHPAVFPIELAARCIKLAGVRDGMVVLDPFAGIGSSLCACKELGVRGIGIDMDAAYCKQARGRLRRSQPAETAQ